jgi:hypothetical protein
LTDRGKQLSPTSRQALVATEAWVETMVIGLNLCPFAKAAQARNQIRYVVCEAHDEESLLSALLDEMTHLVATDPAALETTMLIHPHLLNDFLDFNEFLSLADALLEEQGLEGVLQIASFHPRFQFAGTGANDVTNATNRSPHPTLHLLREDSVGRAVDAFPEPESIYERNIQTMRALGPERVAELQAKCRQAGEGSQALQ